MNEELFEKLREECAIADEAALAARNKYRDAGLAYYEEQKDRMKVAEIAAVIGIHTGTLLGWRKKAGFEHKKTVDDRGRTKKPRSADHK